MNEPPRSYTGRRKLIAEKLEPYFQISAMVAKNTRPTSETDEEFWDNSLLCSWGDRETGRTRAVTVSICRVPDGEERAEEIRAMMREECQPGLNLQSPNPDAYEVIVEQAGEYVFILDYLARVTAIVDHCYIHIMPRGTGIELSRLAEVALDIGHSVGCSPYENDFMLPDLPDEWRKQSVGWFAEGSPPYIPGSSDPEPPASR